ncbi:hypothetical protein [Mycolicibacterium elephantis]|uniref:Uncharacterized protein n=1 Tax=Mycolicibacterium elephantis DSM 44368 TaxID=1335622 RepID=A0A439E0P5_9MYCO|nr:hypothetical protein [Mycolicibacterium elephantis]MCV7221536.1 hypothetical protein [Mycolicibacterium elephantis]RWA23977.1 hypothetical protein MELE44368_01835 [Mycolicibacterium elephantis DSM 44368]
MDADEIERAILDEIANDAELRAQLERIPDRVADTVQSFVPVDTGTAKASIEVQGRRTPYKRLGYRPIKIGTVRSDDDPAKVNTLEFGRGATAEHGATEAFYMFTKAAARWTDVEL